MKKIIATYIIIFLIFTAVFLLLLRSPLFASQKVLFYRGNILLGIVFILLLTSGVCWRITKVRFETGLAALVMSASIHLALFVVFPVTFDRSVTMYLLNRLNTSESASCQGLSPQQMQNLFIKEYVKRDKAIARRIYEQSVIDMLKEKNECVSLTKRGQNFLKLSEFIKSVYAIK
jgi:NADH:ubiquinone oxidoreductase subunit 6 (subunit J)